LKQPDPRDLFKKASNGVCTSTVVVPPDPLSPSTHSTMKTSENTEEDLHATEPESGGDIQMEYLL
jgi:hypothetical protein